MFLIRTRLAPSAIHGIGVFSDEAVAEGQAIWRFERGIDLVIAPERVASLPPAFRHFLDTYAYHTADVPDGLVLSCDHAKFINHSADPNTALQRFETLARRPIEKGEEITCDYRAFVQGWDGFGPPEESVSSEFHPGRTAL